MGLFDRYVWDRRAIGKGDWAFALLGAIMIAVVFTNLLAAVMFAVSALFGSGIERTDTAEVE